VAAVLAAVGADVALLSEVDSGMARTANGDGPREVADALGAGYAFGVEFVELGLGDPAEAAQARGANQRGLHGNLILSRAPLTGTEVVRLDRGGDWFSTDRGQPRVGGRMAVIGEVALDGVGVTVASTHLEAFSAPGRRAEQLEALLAAVDRRRPGAPAVVGGDLNTFGADRAELADRRAWTEARRADPTRFSWPVDHESLFSVARDHGYHWVDANVAAPTTRHHPDGRPDHPPLKLDWILTRGLEARRPTVVPALGTDGTVLSDHDLVAASVRLAAG